MTIRKGEEWGTQSIVPSHFAIAEDDADGAQQEPGVPFALLRGDMHRALGSPLTPVASDKRMIVPVDALLCSITMTNGHTSQQFALSHIAIGSWWRGQHVIISNCGFCSGRNIAPKSHPNDGHFEVVHLNQNMPFKQRLLAHRRTKTGTHTPHPDISINRSTAFSHDRQTAKERLSIDGVAVAQWLSITVVIQEDYWKIIL